MISDKSRIFFCPRTPSFSLIPLLTAFTSRNSTRLASRMNLLRGPDAHTIQPRARHKICPTPPTGTPLHPTARLISFLFLSSVFGPLP
ncbi:hypothetical protein BDV26DRAFT_263956 [Aspergillus bertholletiae]|uniref:Uncharacterized protein n=1 Tax=Aspergillus bertholletiae TaxID=1226010 RepID=A0A5N7B727_9EURO|nr:hypothetical protein BDV26DRAFT_263956 [Aspergillus bertholletiae]